MITIHGLKKCDTCRAALNWLQSEGLAHQFSDVRKDGVSEADMKAWVASLGWEALLNRRGTTWRGKLRCGRGYRRGPPHRFHYYYMM